MLPLLAALALSQGSPPLPVWAVTEFRDLKAGKYGLAATKAVTKRLVEVKAYDVIPDDAVRRAMTTLNLVPPVDQAVDVGRIGIEAMGSAGYERGGTIVSGEVDYRIDRSSVGKRARLALRVVAYDVASVLPMNGALEIGESSVHAGRATDDELLRDALQQAADRVVRTMRGYRVPTATIAEIEVHRALIDRGAREGFQTGDAVIVTRGPIQVCKGKIGIVEPDRAEFISEGIRISIAPGDRVRRTFPLPPLLLGEKSIFGGGMH